MNKPSIVIEPLLFGHYRLIHHIRSVQRTADDLVAADLFSTTLYTADVPEPERRTVDLSRRWSHEFGLALRSLEAHGCIETVRGGDEPVFRLLYDGRKIFSHRLAVFGQFLFRSIAVPVLVSALTAFVTVRLTALLG